MTHSDELVERVARLIHDRTRRFGENTCWDNVRVLSDQRVLSDLGRNLYRNIARDALSAMPGHDDFDEREARAGAAVMLAKTHRLTLLEELLREALSALDGMLAHACVADADPNDKDAEDHDAERRARSAAEKLRAELEVE